MFRQGHHFEKKLFPALQRRFQYAPASVVEFVYWLICTSEHGRFYLYCNPEGEPIAIRAMQGHGGDIIPPAIESYKQSQTTY